MTEEYVLNNLKRQLIGKPSMSVVSLLFTMVSKWAWSWEAAFAVSTFTICGYLSPLLRCCLWFKKYQWDWLIIKLKAFTIGFIVTFGSSLGCRRDDVLHPTRSTKNVKFFIQVKRMSKRDYVRVLVKVQPVTQVHLLPKYYKIRFKQLCSFLFKQLHVFRKNNSKNKKVRGYDHNVHSHRLHGVWRTAKQICRHKKEKITMITSWGIKWNHIKISYASIQTW